MFVEKTVGFEGRGDAVIDGADLMIEVAGVQKVYEAGGLRVRALRGVDLGIARGGMGAIMGPGGGGRAGRGRGAGGRRAAAVPAAYPAGRWSPSWARPGAARRRSSTSSPASTTSPTARLGSTATPSGGCPTGSGRDFGRRRWGSSSSLTT